MMNFKNILKVLLIALFVCAWSGDILAADAQKVDPTTGRIQRDLKDQSPCPEGTQWVAPDNSCMPITTKGGGGPTDGSFCNSSLGIFTELVKTGQMIFNRLRDLIYVVAGFGIIAVAVGGFFGNLNWKWLGAIVISLVVIATAGELIVLLTGCEQFSGGLITNTLSSPTETMTTKDYNEAYTEEAKGRGKIKWTDEYDSVDRYEAGASSSDAGADGDDESFQQ